jgi:hypothetical protein
MADGEKQTDATTVMRVVDTHITTNTMSLIRTLASFKAKGVLRFASETDVIRRTGALFDCGNTLTGRGNEVREVHNVCSTKRVCLGFDSTVNGRTDVDTLKKRFMTATAPAKNNKVSVFVRDAHLLGCAQLSHVLWRTAGRAAFRDLVLTTRFEYDAAYAGAVAPFIASLSTNAIAPPETDSMTEKANTILDLTPASMSSFSGVCVVPTARDATNADDVGTPEEGSDVFVISPPLFGRVVRVNGRRGVTVALPVEGRETEVTTFDGKKNVWVSSTTAARGVLVPASALLFQRKRFPMCTAKATVFVPACFSNQRRKDLVDATRAFFRTVTVVEVAAYDVPDTDNPDARRVVEAVEKKLNRTVN